MDFVLIFRKFQKGEVGTCKLFKCCDLNPHDLNSAVDTYQIVPDELGSGLGGDMAPRTAVELHAEGLCLLDE